MLRGGGAGQGAAVIPQGWDGYHLSGGEQLHLSITLFVYIIITITVIIASFAFLLNCLYLNPPFFTFSPFSSPSHRIKGARSCVVLSCWLESNHDRWVFSEPT